MGLSMLNSISDYFTAEDLETELRGFFDEEEMWKINYKALFNQLEDYNDIYFILKVKGRTFYIDKISCEVEEK